MHFISPKNLVDSIPLSPNASEFIANSRYTIQQIFTRKDPRILLIVGPCSIHNIEEGLAYAKQLVELAKETSQNVYLIMRAYVEKARTKVGWRGFVHDPHLNESYDTQGGLFLTRTFFKELAEMGVPIATEFLTPSLAPYFEDLVSWGCIGARTSSSQIHRLLASDLLMPIGFKNSTEGDVECAINGVHVARHPQNFIHSSEEGKIVQKKTLGNPFAHVVLRGSKSKINYDAISIEQVLNQLRQQELSPRLIVDCSHGNCQGQYFKQKEVFQNVLQQIQMGNQHIFGIMLESNLQAGTQIIPRQLSELQPGVSITDPCIDFSLTAELISSVSTEISLTHN